MLVKTKGCEDIKEQMRPILYINVIILLQNNARYNKWRQVKINPLPCKNLKGDLFPRSHALRGNAEGVYAKRLKMQTQGADNGAQSL